MSTMVDLNAKHLGTLEGEERTAYAALLVEAGLICAGFGCDGCRHCSEEHGYVPPTGGNRYDTTPARGRSADGVTSNQFGTFKNHSASEAQLRFLNRLLDERPMYRNVENLWPNNLAKLTKKAASALIDQVLADCPDPEVAKPAGVAVADVDVPAVAEVEAWLVELGRKVEPDDVTPGLALAATGWAKAWTGTFEFMVDMSKKAKQGSLSQGMAKGVLNCWRADVLRRPVKAADKADPAYEAKKGDVHVIDGRYYRVHVGQHSGLPYAVRADIVREAVWDGDTLVTPGEVDWNYDAGKGFIRKMGEATRATAEQSKAFGTMVGRCCFCSIKIDTPESVTAGYGPKCAEKYGLPWGETTEATHNH